jgi:DNA-binding transcriptional LysR family regulator
MDKLDTMKAFLMVAEEGSFSKAADKLGLSPQLVSKYVSHLEDILHIRLLNRTTRKVSMTEAGTAYYERCHQVLIDIEEMENALSDLHQNVSGILTISAPMSFGTKHLPKLLTDFQRQYPDIIIKLDLSDRKVDIIEEGIDVALRIGHLKSSSLIAKKITPINIAICASPGYLEKRGIPLTPEDLKTHIYLKYTYTDNSNLFSRLNNDEPELHFENQLIANNGEILANAAIHDGGIVVQPTFITGEALAEGKLKRILPGYEPEPLNLYAVYAHRKFLASKVRCFIDFVSQYYGEMPYWDQEYWDQENKPHDK